ncbi:MAG: NOB1 family endonuclease [Nitrososphaera sp.]
MDSQDSAFSYALDAGAFYTGLVFSASLNRYYTTRAVFNEIKHIKKSLGAVEALIESNKLQVLDSDRKSVEKVITIAIRTGDYAKLSEADISIIALAFKLNITLITNDYAVANVALSMKIPVKSMASRESIRTRRWIAYCSACGKTFGVNAKECGLCGNRLRRKYKDARPSQTASLDA